MTPVTRTNIALLVLRVGIGLIAMYYGAQKMFGIFGGLGLHPTVELMKGRFGIPPVMAVLAMVAELFGGLGMVVGLLANLAAFGLACTMAVAAFETWRDPSLANQLFGHGTPQIASQAFSAPSLFLGAFAVMMMGAGGFSVDSRLFGQTKKKPRA